MLSNKIISGLRGVKFSTLYSIIYPNTTHLFTIIQRAKSNSNDDNDKDGFFNVFEDMNKLRDDKAKLTEYLDQIKSSNAFKLFRLDQKFTIDERKLQLEMQALQRNLHPDKYLKTDPKAFERSQQLSSMINDLYAVLKHPYKRGKYLLSLIEKKDQSEIEKRLENYKVDQQFLMRMMEMREQVEDGTKKNDELIKFFADLESELIQMTKELDDQFEAKNIDNIYKMLAKLKFLANCHHVLAERLESFSRF